ncbi:MAG: glycosyltransferase family 2 protein [Acidobacteriota bacterium]
MSEFVKSPSAVIVDLGANGDRQLSWCEAAFQSAASWRASLRLWHTQESPRWRRLDAEAADSETWRAVMKSQALRPVSWQSVRYPPSVVGTDGLALTKSLPATAVIATCHRAQALSRTLASLLAQDALPAELFVVDASVDGATRLEVEALAAKLSDRCAVRWMLAEASGAAAQRNQGVIVATQPFVWFFDDDIIFEPHCVARLWRAINADPSIGGVNATITNQGYHSPGPISRTLFTLLDGRRRRSFAGRVIGPAVNLLPEDRPDLPDAVPVEWLNTGCTIYRRSALPKPPFDPIFSGYSMMEDLALSLRVGRKWRLVNARTARIVHDSQPSEHKSDVGAMAKMELVNRYYVMTEVLERKRPTDLIKLLLWEAFQLTIALIRADRRQTFPAMWRGKIRALRQIGEMSNGFSTLHCVGDTHEGECEPSIGCARTPSASVIVGIVTRNRAAMLTRAISSVLAQQGCEAQVAVVDDDSTDTTSEVAAQFPEVTWTCWSPPRGYRAARNQWMTVSDYDYFVSLDDDAWFLRGDEISLAIAVLKQQPHVAAVAFDILSPDRPFPVSREAPRRAAMFIGCGHVVRLAAIRSVGGYDETPGDYGGEEKDLCLRLMDAGHQIVLLPGVHVWHEKTPIARAIPDQHRSGVCNDLVMTLKRTPTSLLPIALLSKLCRHLISSRRHRLMRPCLAGFCLFARSIPSVWRSRRAIKATTLRAFMRLSRS